MEKDLFDYEGVEYPEYKMKGDQFGYDVVESIE